jgi:sortase A
LAPPHVLESGELFGRLTIPRLKLESVVREGAGEKTLDVALGHIPGTAGNVGIAGHRDTLFRGLRHIARNDVIQLQTPTGAYSYQVEDTSIVKPEDVRVLNPGPHPELTLVTCYPFYYVGPAPDRFIVKARLVLPPPVPEKPAVVTQSAVVAKPPVPKPAPRRQLPAGILRVRFEVHERHSREVAPGILIGLSTADARHRRANGWLWGWSRTSYQVGAGASARDRRPPGFDVSSRAASPPGFCRCRASSASVKRFTACSSSPRLACERGKEDSSRWTSS